MTDVRWLTAEMVDALHEMQIAEHGGSPGKRDEGLLRSALARPRNAAAYGEASLRELAAAYAFGIVRNHPYADGNKRTGFMAAYVFLRLNGLLIEAPEEDVVILFRDLAAGAIEEGELAAWLEEVVRPERSGG